MPYQNADSIAAECLRDAAAKADAVVTEETRSVPRLIIREIASKQQSVDCSNGECRGEELPGSDRLEQARTLSRECGISLIAARILLSRGIATVEQVSNFLSPSLRHHLPDPCEIKNITAAAELILDFIDSGGRISIYTDFDVDGVSSGSQLFLFLKALGANVNTYTPSRFAEGYGLVCSAVQKLADSGTKLLITVDCGITSHREFALAARLGMKSIVVDHHLPNGIPPADVVVDPAQDGCPFQEHKLAAAGLVWMLLIVLRKAARNRWRDSSRADTLPDPKEFLDLAALGTICDMVPLMGLNRVIAHRGVEAMRKTARPGMIALKQVAGVDNNPRFGSGHVAFALGPRINAAGRLAEAADVIHLLTTDDSIRAKAIASTIDRLNDRRREVEESVKNSCLRLLAAEERLRQRAAFAIFGEEYHIGVIGIVAQRLVEQFHRPAAIMAPGEMLSSTGERRAVIKGSVRSVTGFHVADVLQSLSSLLITHGGHREAGGFSLALENLAAFQEAFICRAEELLGSGDPAKTLTVDAEVNLRDIDFELVNELMRFAPFGVGNPSPVFVTRNVDVTMVSLLGDKHLRVRFSEGGVVVAAVGWGMQGHELLRKGRRVSIAYQPEINTYQGIASVQLNLREVW
jgi:single-stranded-DNA-specific exonuclease